MTPKRPAEDSDRGAMADHARRDLRVAVLVPCLGEGPTVAQVVQGFARAGKGRILAGALLAIDADIHVMVDGDGTYDPELAPQLVARICEGVDLAVCSRRETYAQSASRVGHEWGNRTLTGLVNRMFSTQFADVLSGYRAFNRRLARTLPGLAVGFELEIAMTVHALEIGARVEEIEGSYRPRAPAAASKLRTWADGARILWTLAYLVKQIRPFLVFGWLAAACYLAALGLGMPLVATYLETGLVPRVPTAIVVVGVAVVGTISLAIGLLLDSVSAARRELKRALFQLADRARRQAAR